MPYDLAGFEFDVAEFFTDKCFASISDVRVSRPDAVREHAAARKRREALTKDGKLVILAADHPGRNITKSGEDPLIMGNRQEYLGRVLRVVTSDHVDGLMGTPDVLEDALAADMLIQEGGGPSFLDGKLLVGSMNRGGLAGASFEMDDKYTSFTAASIASLNMDAAKIMFRLDLTNADSGNTIHYSAQAVDECHERGITVFAEPLPVVYADGKYNVQKESGELAKIAGVAAAVGGSSLGTWLKMPYCDGYDQVARATTLPILMLGGESLGNPTPIIEDFANGMAAGPNVRGALCGRNILFPGDDDPRAVAAAVSAVVHEGASADSAVDKLQSVRGEDMGGLSKWI
ncbi:MAG: deoxyribose-phosphate aldolase [Armatimonadota bacterium]|jgi:DhnA family fructose-bisphosphate aldolase class Ia